MTEPARVEALAAGGRCPDEAQSLLLLDGALEADQLRAYAPHLETCTSCRGRLRQLSSIEPEYQELLRRGGGQTPAEASRVDAFVRNLQEALVQPEHSGLLRDAMAVTRIASHAGRLPFEQMGPYRVKRCAGIGGMSVVYEATDTRLGRPVALKLLLLDDHGPEVRSERFEREAAVLARLSHPNIVPIYEIREHQEQPFLVLEYIAGGTLARWAMGRVIEPAEAARAIQTLALAVQYAHDQGVVHRDLKPGNVLLQPLAPEPGGQAPATPLPLSAYRLMIADFGLARWRNQSSQLTRTDHPLGTPAYMAPEQASGQQQDIGPSADLYALGAMLYELITGRPPLRASTVVGTLQLVQEAEPVAPSALQPWVPRDLETITLKCLEKAPQRRYATAADLAEELDRFLTGRPILAHPIRLPGRVWRWCGRNRRLAATGALALTLLVVLAVGGLTAAWVQAGLRRQAEASAGQMRQAQQRANDNLREAITTLDQIAAGVNALMRPPLDGPLLAFRDTCYRREIRWCEQFLQQSPEPERWGPQQLHVAVILVRLQCQLGQSSDVEVLARQAVEVAERLVEPSRTEPQSQALYSGVYWNLARVYAESGRLSGAIECLRQIERQVDAELTRSPEDSGLLAQRYSLRGQIAEYLDQSGDPAAALAESRASLEAIATIQRQHPEVDQYRLFHGQRVSQVVGLLGRLGRRQEALSLVGPALAALDSQRNSSVSHEVQAAWQALLRRWTELVSLDPPGAALTSAIQLLRSQQNDPELRQRLPLELAPQFVAGGHDGHALALAELAAAEAGTGPPHAVEIAALFGTLARGADLDAIERERRLARALTVLDQAIHDGSLTGTAARDTVRQRPELNALHDRPDFQRLLDLMAAAGPQP